LTDLPQPSRRLTGDKPAAASAQGLVDRRELALIAVERTRMPMLVTDARQADNPIILANRAFLDLTGYGADEVIGRNCRILQGEDTCKAAVAEIRAALIDEREVNVELINYRKDGTSFWNQLHLSPIHDDDGQLLYYFGSQLDVTQRHKVEVLEAAQRRLLMEVDHRSMNVLAIVEGIVRLTRAENTPMYAAAVQRRVQALARAHTILAERGWTDVPLARVIQGQIEPFGAGRVEFDGPEVLLAGHLVQPLALVFHELGANAAMHGCLKAPTGALRVQWSQDAKRNSVDLDWSELGGPVPKAERSAGFGSTIIKGIVDRQLRGKLHRAWEEDGLKAHLSFSLAA
jgi:PAS domain S-box-containing protein